MSYCPPLRPVPEDFAEHAHDSYKANQERFRAGYHTMRRWYAETGIPVPFGQGQRQRKHPPADYATTTIGISRRQVAKTHGVSEDTAERWDRELGIVRPRHLPGRKPATKPVRRVSVVSTFMTAPVDRPHMDMSYAGRAAEYLRKYGPVIRCDERGRFDIAGTHWRRGSTLLDAAQIIDRAVRNGFDADAWKRVA